MNVRFEVAIQAEPDVSAPELKSWAETDRALSGIGNIDIVNPVIGHLLQPIPVEAKPHMVVQLVGSRVVDMKGLPRLQVSDAEPRKRIVIG